MENCATTESVVLSITNVNQMFTEVKQASSTGKQHTPGGIVRSIAGIHKLFEDVMRNCESIQKFYSDLADLALKIRIQQVAFDNGCKMLLVTAAKSRQDVDNMIENRGHPIWRDKMAHRNLDTMMARFYNLCLVALEHFQESLSKLVVGLHALKGQETKKATSKYQFLLENWNPPTLGTTNDFPKLLQNLRNYNDIFCTLIWQAVPRRSGHQFGLSFGGDLACPYLIRAARASQVHFGCIQQASQLLHDTLSIIPTCRQHEAHSLNIALNFDYAKTGATGQAEDFCFNVTVTCPSSARPYQLIVYVAHGGCCMYQKVTENRFPKKTYLRNRITRSAAWTKSSDVSKLDTDAAAYRHGGQRVGTSVRAEALQDKVSDLGLEKDLCHRLRNLSVTTESKQVTESSCLGYLETRTGLRLLIHYFRSDEYRKVGSYTLEDVLVRANKERRAFPVEDRLRIALFLAAGVLQLSSSVWLRPTWSSKDILFFDMDDKEKWTLGQPFLQTKLDNDTARGPVYETKSQAATRSCLLSLGLVLIELAFAAPWRKLQLEESLTEDLFEWEKNLLDLMRLSDTVSRELGSRYAKVVQICLFQGLETQETQDLGKAEIDQVLFEDIVGELDRCLSAVTF